jgi:hypothetical protein
MLHICIQTERTQIRPTMIRNLPFVLGFEALRGYQSQSLLFPMNTECRTLHTLTSLPRPTPWLQRLETPHSCTGSSVFHGHTDTRVSTLLHWLFCLPWPQMLDLHHLYFDSFSTMATMLDPPHFFIDSLLLPWPQNESSTHPSILFSSHGTDTRPSHSLH